MRKRKRELRESWEHPVRQRTFLRCYAIWMNAYSTNVSNCVTAWRVWKVYCYYSRRYVARAIVRYKLHIFGKKIKYFNILKKLREILNFQPRVTFWNFQRFRMHYIRFNNKYCLKNGVATYQFYIYKFVNNF